MREPFTQDESTLQSVLLKARNIGHTLQETGLFHYVNASVEPTRDVAAPVHDIDLVFKTKEKGRLQLKTSTEFGNQEGSAVCEIPRYFPTLFKFALERRRSLAQCLRRSRGVGRPIVLRNSNETVFPYRIDSPPQSHTFDTRCSVNFWHGT